MPAPVRNTLLATARQPAAEPRQGRGTSTERLVQTALEATPLWLSEGVLDLLASVLEVGLGLVSGLSFKILVVGGSTDAFFRHA